MLSYILKNGNVTVYQWQHGEPPIPDQNQTPAAPTSGLVPDEELSIDWGAGLEGGVATGGGMTVAQDDGIDFGEIDFGDVSLSKEEDLSFITLEESGVGGVAPQEGEGRAGGVALQPDEKERREYNGNSIINTLNSSGHNTVYASYRTPLIIRTLSCPSVYPEIRTPLIIRTQCLDLEVPLQRCPNYEGHIIHVLHCSEPNDPTCSHRVAVAAGEHYHQKPLPRRPHRTEGLSLPQTT